MENEFDVVMSQRTNTELIAILNSNDGDYKPVALEAAKKELKKRSLTEVQLTEAKLAVEQRKIVVENQSKEPLAVTWKILAFIFPGIIPIIVAAVFKFNGYERKSKVLWRWTLYGIAFYLIVFVLVFVFA